MNIAENFVTVVCLIGIIGCGSTVMAQQLGPFMQQAPTLLHNIDWDHQPELRQSTLQRVIVVIQQMQDQDQSFYDSGVDYTRGFNTISQQSIFGNTQKLAISLGRRQRQRYALLNFLARQFNMSRTDLSRALDGLLAGSDVFHLVTQGTGCKPSSTIRCDGRYKYRTADGSCNNLQNPFWGKSFIAMRRFVNPVYDDGVSYPRARGRHGRALPSPRRVSSELHASRQDSPDDQFATHMVMQWGQFLDHDLTSTPVHRGLSGSAVTCCLDDLVPANLSHAILDNLRHRDICFPIPMPRNDHRFGHRSCLNFVRSIQVANADCSDVPVEQLNQVTAYIDGSHVYGSTEEEQNSLRTGTNGVLRSSLNGLLPRSDKAICETDVPGAYCFKAGDERANEQMGLTTMHTTWMREHNRIATKLQNLNPHWRDERVFQESRRIVAALLQHITYDEFLPSVLSQSDMAAWGLASPPAGFHDVYDPKVDASIRNAFATAAFRFGHSLVRAFMSHYTRDYMFDGDSLLQHIFGNTSVILSNTDRINTFLRGLTIDRCSKMDRFLSSQILDHLFEDRNGDALDLAALNIQRGRDHGLPGYNHWRKLCKLTVATTFNSNHPQGLVDHPYEDAEILRSLYSHPDDIDLFPAAISEKPVPGGLVGPTITCLLAKQFSVLKTGDRFWYERKNDHTGFTLDQLNSIKSVSLARVMCDNSNIEKIQPHVFWKIGMDEQYMNPVVGCWSLPALDLSLWKDDGAYWSNWSQWSPCFANFRHRSRTCPNDVAMCDGPNTQFQKCTKQSCDKFVTPEDRFHCLMNVANIFDFKK